MHFFLNVIFFLFLEIAHDSKYLNINYISLRCDIYYLQPYPLQGCGRG